MSNIYNRGNTFIKYLNVLFLSGAVPTFPDDYTTPTFSIVFKNGLFSIILADSIMTQGLNNIWFFSYHVPLDASLGTYLIKYKVTINGVDTEVTEDFLVELPSGTTEIGPGVGMFTITDTVEDASMVDLSGVDVFIFLPSDTNNAIAHATTDTNGQFTVQLDEGTYITLFNKTGYISETHQLTVDSMGGHAFLGD